MRTAFASWKLAKGLYIIPLVMAYRPLLGMGDQYELLHWEVILTMVTTTLGLVAFASALERFCLRSATVLETGLFWLAAVGLLWTSYWTEAVGFVLLLTALGLQCRKKNILPLASAAN
jgi:TRAP-type uncharacterized transport system fused permease subunit